MGVIFGRIRRGLIVSVLFFCISCTKLTQVPEPINTITTTETFSTDATATSAIIGIYQDIVSGSGSGISYGNGLMSIDCGMSADELHMFNGPSPFEINALVASYSSNNFWPGPYYDIYLANAAIETLPGSSGVDAATKKQLIGEAMFFRAFCHFYLVNLFGDVPLVTTTAYTITDTLHRTPSVQVYQQIVADLKVAQNDLASDYSVSNGERTRVNQFAATALLARTYLYEQKWDSAEEEASNVIGNSQLYNLVGDLDSAFLANNSEAIFQLQTPNTYPYSTAEGNELIPYDSTANPNYYLTTELLAAFEPGDQRRIAWVDSTDYQSSYYYYPFKYKVFVGTQGNIAEYYMVLRLAEQYLIRAEARAQQNNFNGAIADLNVIRERAGLSDLSSSTLTTQSQILSAIMQERRVELFAEWGNRWFDLKRTNSATTVLTADKGVAVGVNALLYPIPSSELVDDANLVQNAGY